MAEVPPFLWADAGDFDSPVVYTVPGSGEVQPYTATATYVNASGQAILPALRIKSAEGALLSLTFPVGQTIADAASSEVTFVPPFGSASAASTTPAVSGLPSAYAAASNSVTVGVGGDILRFTNAQWGASDYSIFTDMSSGKLGIAAPGLYACWGTAAPTVVQSYNFLDIRLEVLWRQHPSSGSPWAGDGEFGGQRGGNLFGVNSNGAANTTSENYGEVLSFAWLNIGAGSQSSDTTATAQLFMDNTSAAGVTVTSRSMLVVQVLPFTADNIQNQIPTA